MGTRVARLAALLGLVAAPVAAQGVTVPRAPKPDRPESVTIVMDSMRVRLDSLRSGNLLLRDSMQTVMVRAFARRRVRIGVVVSTLPSETDSVGARIDAVTPGGPASTAGLRAGDVITTFGTTKLAVSLTKVTPGVKVASPGVRLVELVAKLAPNDTVPVEYRRGTANRKTRVVTAAEPDDIAVVVGPEGNFEFGNIPGAQEYWVGRDAVQDQRAMEIALLRSEAARGARASAELQYSFFLGGGLRDLELAPVNPQLGSYFGTTDGVLVVDVPDPAPLELKAGDVVLNVDGREVSSPRQLMRILGSYEPGEPIRLEVMRQKKRVTLKGSLGGQRGAPEPNR